MLGKCSDPFKANSLLGQGKAGVIESYSECFLPTLEGRRILIAENETAILQLLKRLLSFHRVVVSEASNGEQALQLLRDPDQNFDLVVLDMVMPKLGGLKVRDLLRSETPDLPVLIMSGSIGPRPVGLDPLEYIAKPFSITGFCARLQLLLRRRLGGNGG